MTTIKTGRPPKDSYIVQRGNVWYYVRDVPPDLREKLGKSRWKVSLKTAYKAEALQKAHKLAVEHDEKIADARAPAPIDRLTPADRARILEAGGIDAFVAWLNDRAGDARSLKVEAENLSDFASNMPIEVPQEFGGGFLASDPAPADGTPDNDWTRSKVAGLNAERQAIENQIAREAPLLRQLRIPEKDLAREHPALAEALQTTPLDRDHITLSGALADWTRQKNVQNPEQYAYPIRLFEDRFGALPLKQITKTHMREFRDLLPTLPKAAGSAYSGSTLAQLQALARRGKPLISRATASKYLRSLGTILRFAVSEGYIEDDPSAGIRFQTVRGKFSDTQDADRRSLTPGEIQAVLDAAAAYVSTGDPKDSETGWFARLAIYTGARGEELAQLTPDDIVLGGKTPYLRITDAGDDALNRKVKNKPSLRIVPIHRALLDMGFAKFVKSREGARWLFLTLVADGRGRRYSRMNRRLTLLIRGGERQDPNKPGHRAKIAAAWIDDARVVPHSLRHTFQDCLRIARVPDEIADRLTGRVASGRTVAMGYGTPGQIAVLADWMTKIDPLDPTRTVSSLEH